MPKEARLPDCSRILTVSCEADAIQTKNRKESAYCGMRTFFPKIGAAPAGAFLSIAGFAPNPAVRPATALFTVRFVTGPIHITSLRRLWQKAEL